MARWIVMIESNPRDESVENDYHKWYEEIHVPDAIEFGCVSIKRIINRDPEPGRGKFAVFYEMETDDVDQSIIDIEAFMAKKGEQGRMPSLGQMVKRTVFQVVSHHLYETFAYTGARKFA